MGGEGVQGDGGRVDGWEGERERVKEVRRGQRRRSHITGWP